MKPNDEIDELRRSLITALPLLGLADAAQAQDAARVQPRAYRVVLENDRLRVLEYTSKPGMGVCGNGVHSHPAHLSVALTAARARVRLPDGRTIVAENRIGDVWWEEASTHEVENITGRDVRALLIELKTAAKS